MKSKTKHTGGYQSVEISRHFTSALMMALLFAMISSCAKEDVRLDSELEAVTLKSNSETLDSQLKMVKQKVMRFHSFEQAKKSGYAEPFPFNPSPYVPNMGYHYINVGLMDGTFDMKKPEILLYVPKENGVLELVGVEYAIPVALSERPPEGFTGGEDHWEFNPNVAGGAWTLHAWVVIQNPDGVFAEFNPSVPSSDPSLD